MLFAVIAPQQSYHSGIVSTETSHYVKPHSALCRWRLRALSFTSLLIGAGFALPSFAAVTCTVSATPVAFGVYDPLVGTADVTTGSVTASCTLTGTTSTTVNIVSSYSTGSSGTYAARTMKSGANQLTYNLYFDNAYTQIRGDGTGGSHTGGASFSLTKSNPTQSTTSTIYGRAPAGQDVAAGTYSDTITVTITY